MAQVWHQRRGETDNRPGSSRPTDERTQRWQDTHTREHCRGGNVWSTPQR
jgi:hypothetical protein